MKPPEFNDDDLRTISRALDLFIDLHLDDIADREADPTDDDPDYTIADERHEVDQAQALAERINRYLGELDGEASRKEAEADDRGDLLRDERSMKEKSG